MDFNKRVEIWETQNPLRRWREETETSRSRVAATVSVSLNSVVNWENGCTIPNDDHMSSIAHILGCDTETMKSRWYEWLSGMRG